MTLSRLFTLLLLCVFLVPGMEARNQIQEIVWPPSGPPVLKFSVGKFRQQAPGSNTYSVDIRDENLSGRKINTTYFYLYIFDKKKTRVGEVLMPIINAAPGEVISIQRGLRMSGAPVSFEIEPRSMPGDLPSANFSMTVNSVPQGATLKVDEKDAGTTPATIDLAPGRHWLEFTKGGLGARRVPLVIRPGDAPVGSVTYALQPVTRDTVELNDGSLLSGEVESVSATEVIIRIDGKLQHLDRSQVRNIQFIEKVEPTR